MRSTFALAALLVFAGCASTEPAQQLPPPRDPSAPREQLDKRDIVDGMNRIKPAVGACFGRFHQPGVFNVAMTIAGSGKVAHASVNGPDRDTNDCIAVAAGAASFPPFSGEPQSIVYPFVFR